MKIHDLGSTSQRPARGLDGGEEAMSIASTNVGAPVLRGNARVLAACMVGTSIEYYDFFIYSTAAALVLGPLFFPSASPSAQVLSAYATFAVAFVARPLGGAFFGHFGDRIGRKSTLVAALLTMGVCTILIGLLPGYDQIGWAAPVLLCLLRFGQGFGLGGEWGGAALMAVENAPPGWAGRFAMFPQLGAPVGIVAANAVFLAVGLLLTPDQFNSWGWRIPFLLSALLIGVGLWVRLKVAETPHFKAALEKAPPATVPTGELLRNHTPVLLGGAAAVIASAAIFYLVVAFSLSHGVRELGYERQSLLGVQMFSICFMGFGILVAGWWCDRTNPRVVMMVGSAGLAVAGFLLPFMLVGGALLSFCAFLCLSCFLLGFVSGPLGAILPSLFPTRVRYSGASIAFNLGCILGGALAPMIATTLAAWGGLGPVGLYYSAAGLISLLALLALKRSAGRHLA